MLPSPILCFGVSLSGFCELIHCEVYIPVGSEFGCVVIVEVWKLSSSSVSLRPSPCVKSLMAFTLPQLREELVALGYGGIPDHVIISSLSQLEFENPSWKIEKIPKYRSSSHSGVHASRPSRQVHGAPVPGDREFAKTKKSNVNRGGLDSVCFTSDFATEIDEMRKMLRIMEGTKGELVASLRTRSNSGKRNGLEDEHDHYVGNLLCQWRQVGRILRSKRIEKPVAAGEKAESSFGATGSYKPESTKQLEKVDEVDGTLLPSSEEFASSQELQPDDSDRCDLPECNGDGLTPCERTEGEEVQAEELLMPRIQRRDIEEDHQAIGGSATNAEERDVSAFESGKAADLDENATCAVLTRQASSSSISPGICYQRGGMLYSENFVERNQYSDGDYSGEVLATDHDSQENPSPSPPSSPHNTKTLLHKLSFLSDDEFIAAFEQSLQELDPRDTIDQETFANLNQKIANTTPSVFIQAPRPLETENPPDLSFPVLRTPDRRGGDHQSPLYDRSNTHIAESRTRTKPLFRIADFNSSVAQKRNSSISLKRCQSSRDSRRSETAEHTGTYLSEVAEDRADSRLPAVSINSPPSARKLRLEKGRRHSEKDSTRNVTIRNKCAHETYHPDILSPTKVGDPLSPLKLSGREGLCGANGLAEHRQGTCTVCPLPYVRKDGDSNPQSVTGIRSPFGKGQELEASSPIRKLPLRKDPEASPKQKVPLRKDPEASPRQKVQTLTKGSGPSGIYTPLLDHKKYDINSKVLLKTSRLNSTMEFNSGSSRPQYRQTPSSRSSTDSSRSSGLKSTTSSQDSKSVSGSSPYTRSSSSTSVFGSGSGTPKDKLTPGGPRRGGKVDRVASALEDMRPASSDTPPFVVPTLYSSEGLKSR